MRSRCLLCALLGLAASAAPADWLVFVGGGIQQTQGPWEVRGRQVQFHSAGGTLMSARSEDVDLPSSAFLTWQVGDRKRAPSLRRPAPAPPPEPSPCLPARVERVVCAETYELAIDRRREIVHVACLDAPEVLNRVPELAWYGRTTAGVVEGLVRPGLNLCFVEENPPQRDRQEHRQVYLRLGDGRDLGGELIARGLGLARADACARGESYRVLEEQARIHGRGHWGPSGSAAAVAIVSQALSLQAAPAAPATGLSACGR